jgi:ADP-ribose pyrophosphatase YjhB (NUDIX family)
VIPKADYTKILANVPVATVDILVVHAGKYLLVKRKKKPLKGKWWTPGGRVLRGEMVKDAVYRKLAEEIGIKTLRHTSYGGNLVSMQFVGVYEDMFMDNEFGLRYIHTISSVFRVELAMTPNIWLDGQSSAFKWAKKLPERLRILRST